MLPVLHTGGVQVICGQPTPLHRRSGYERRKEMHAKKGFCMAFFCSLSSKRIVKKEKKRRMGAEEMRKKNRVGKKEAGCIFLTCHIFFCCTFNGCPSLFYFWLVDATTSLQGSVCELFRGDVCICVCVWMDDWHLACVGTGGKVTGEGWHGFVSLVLLYFLTIFVCVAFYLRPFFFFFSFYNVSLEFLPDWGSCSRGRVPFVVCVEWGKRCCRCRLFVFVHECLCLCVCVFGKADFCFVVLFFLLYSSRVSAITAFHAGEFAFITPTAQEWEPAKPKGSEYKKKKGKKRRGESGGRWH
ncbi:fatty acid transporter protein-like, putative [Trypanosoma cruzi marinkellei]|uniref:Fatty acid transporter protein-like, putative n=1 Tax=Trypanosoma cruzi marinkellei TaxID=85056 RepID=K2NEJ5_TRYCR|nr:fatty acid transporter protein-like, putative [Trypanosoma cruzi marinkellei]